jgi:hypothetical protein
MRPLRLIGFRFPAVYDQCLVEPGGDIRRRTEAARPHLRRHALEQAADDQQTYREFVGQGTVLGGLGDARSQPRAGGAVTLARNERTQGLVGTVLVESEG